MKLRPVDYYCPPDLPTKQHLDKLVEAGECLPMPRRFRHWPVVSGMALCASAFLCLVPTLGTYACIAAVPPTYISEEEMLAAIQEEARLAGIELVSFGTPTAIIDEEVQWEGMNLLTISFDLATEDGQIAIEYVSRHDALELVQHDQAHSGYVATSLVESIFAEPEEGEIEFTGKTEPHVLIAGAQFRGTERQIDRIRDQVREFLQFLKAEGVI